MCCALIDRLQQQIDRRHGLAAGRRAGAGKPLERPIVALAGGRGELLRQRTVRVRLALRLGQRVDSPALLADQAAQTVADALLCRQPSLGLIAVVRGQATARAGAGQGNRQRDGAKPPRDAGGGTGQHGERAHDRTRCPPRKRTPSPNCVLPRSRRPSYAAPLASSRT